MVDSVNVGGASAAGLFAGKANLLPITGAAANAAVGVGKFRGFEAATGTVGPAGAGDAAGLTAATDVVNDNALKLGKALDDAAGNFSGANAIGAAELRDVGGAAGNFATESAGAAARLAVLVAGAACVDGITGFANGFAIGTAADEAGVKAALAKMGAVAKDAAVDALTAGLLGPNKLGADEAATAVVLLILNTLGAAAGAAAEPNILDFDTDAAVPNMLVFAAAGAAETGVAAAASGAW